VKTTLARSRCFGPCPAYEVEIDGDGSVLFTETYPVSAQHRASISRDTLERLLEIFQKADYFSLSRDYMFPVTDLPDYRTSISIDGKTMSVHDYGGLAGRHARFSSRGGECH
jgi:Domain of unknown function (DUF6438)